jgi:delta8-fatty-acid desaturase
MQAYRIGKVDLPWTNFTPPIRGGLYERKSVVEIEAEENSVSEGEEAEWSDWAVESTSSRSSIASADVTRTQARTRNNVKSKARTAQLTVPRWSPDDDGAPLSREVSNLSRDEYTTALEDAELASEIEAYPSLDACTQRAISQEYKDLHERIEKEGFYVCRYSEYGKDAIRWAMLFAAFACLVRVEWYLTAAVFLGMFWVC